MDQNKILKQVKNNISNKFTDFPDSSFDEIKSMVLAEIDYLKTDNAKYLCDELNIDINDIYNIYPYGSKVYGNAKPTSDSDYIIVFKAALLKSGAFKDNAISNPDRSIQASCFSRGGFADAINNYNMSALEAISVSSEDIIKNDRLYEITKYIERDMIKKVIIQSSSSWHIAERRWVMEKKLDNLASFLPIIQKGIWHALRILIFGLQIKEHQKIIDFSAANWILNVIENDNNFCPRNYLNKRNELMDQLRKN